LPSVCSQKIELTNPGKLALIWKLTQRKSVVFSKQS